MGKTHIPDAGSIGRTLTVSQLSRATQIRVEQLRVLVDAGYLRVVKKGLNLAKTRIGKFGPVACWPYVRLKDIARRPPKTTVEGLQRLCALYGIRVLKDPMLGEVLTPIDVHRLLSCQQTIRNPKRVDRISILLWLCGLDTPNPLKAPVFELAMEREARRVAKLPIRARVDQALILLSRYRDAEEIADALHREDIRSRQVRLDTGKEFRKRMEKTAGID